MLTIADLWKQGKIIINRIRFGLVLLFLLAMIGAKDEFQPKMFLIHMVGTCTMGFYCAVAYVLEKKTNPCMERHIGNTLDHSHGLHFY
ncbi:hypothetical protein [Leptospira vanthielii]|uniref:Uncharacterized protein n=1 Tax=Leptospira vanthielii serovar Holland str. Waz Holland = ATCC 700522 TaxID=1218591 RepID=N1W289_9LEPT|nr:hypothetical protein [Leptospira vanthielii]EMY69143.1 hypothetical protein LEP1GSC199_3455 [Leptospira vanthielii serovar Holland str. Waz Holland = ATCC 700522]